MAFEQTLSTQVRPHQPKGIAQDLLVQKAPEKMLPEPFLRFLNGFAVNPTKLENALVLKRPFEINLIEEAASHTAKANCIVNLERLNDVRYINKFLESVNARLVEGGLIVGRIETNAQRYFRIMDKYPYPVGKTIYFFDFLVKRVWPKLPRLRKLYFRLSKGKNRALSDMETIGRLISCGFKVLHTGSEDGKFYFLAEKVKEPDFNHQVTYDPLIRLNRTGKDGKPIRVLKFRTMYPYSEYLQAYIYEQRGLQEGGKINNDPRINSVGRFMRRCFLDELPMLINWLRGDLKLFGVRPLSKHYLSLYPEDFQQDRHQFKPGLIPPYYVDMPKTLIEIVDSEKRYLENYEKHGWLTDIRYMGKAAYNIIIRKARSC